MPPKLRSGADGVADGFTAEGRKSLIDLLSYAKRIDSKMKMIKDHVKKQNELIMQQNDVIATQSKQINDLIAQINCVNYRGDAQQQYNRREGVKARNVNGLGNDAFEIMKEVCKLIEDTAPPYKGNSVSIDLQPNDIHRCHFMGEDDKKSIICKFTPAAYKKKMILMLNKKYVNQVTTGKFKDFFIAEDLTPTRSHLLWYIKSKYSSKYHKVHSRNGVIKMKNKNDESNDGSWISVSNPDDLHALVGDDDFNVEEFNKGLWPFKVLSSIPVPTFNGLIQDIDWGDDDNFVPPISSSET